MTKPYIVSKNYFFNLLSSADGMLDSLGRFASPIPFSHHYSIYTIKRFNKADPEVWLKQTFTTDCINWMIELENAPYVQAAPEPKLTQADVITSIQLDRFINAERFINVQLNIGLMHLVPELELQERFKYSNSLAAWKIADQLMFMSDKWSWNRPTWYISLKTKRFECHIMAVLMKYGFVMICFNYPTSGSILEKDIPADLLNPPDLH